MFTNLGKLSLVTVRKNMGEFGRPEVVYKVENEEMTKVDHPKSDTSNEGHPQDNSKNKTNSTKTTFYSKQASGERYGTHAESQE